MKVFWRWLLLGALSTGSWGASANCTEDDIEVRLVQSEFVDACGDGSCPTLRGSAVVVNRCAEAVGIQVKLIAWDRDDEKVAVSQYWPFGRSDVPPGEHEFSIGSRIGYKREIAKFTIESAGVIRWGQ